MRRAIPLLGVVALVACEFFQDARGHIEAADGRTGVACGVTLRNLAFQSDVPGRECHGVGGGGVPITGGDFVCTESDPIGEYQVRIECLGYARLETSAFAFCMGECGNVSLGTLAVVPVH